jgi:F-type H+-transporting ATPase subunit a
MEEGIHVAIASEKLSTIFGVSLTNTLIMSWVVVLLLIILSIFIRKSLARSPSKLQVLFEMLVQGIYDFVFQTLENEKLAKIFSPFLMALFLFILVGNWLEFIPGVESIVYHFTPDHSVPVLRGLNTDMNVTLALAIIAFFAIEITGILTLGFFKYAGKFLNFHSPIGFFVGILELVSEMIRLVSFSFRLFGNIFGLNSKSFLPQGIFDEKLSMKFDEILSQNQSQKSLSSPS